MTSRPDRARHMSHTCLPTLVPPEQGKHRLQDHEPERMADEGVAGQGIHDGGHDPDREIPPAAPGSQCIHRQRDRDAGDVQRAGPQRPPAVQGQRDPEGREDQRAGVGDARLQRGDRRDALDRVDQDVLRIPADHSRSQCEDSQGSDGITQPGAAGVPASRLPGPGANDRDGTRVASIAGCPQGLPLPVRHACHRLPPASAMSPGRHHAAPRLVASALPATCQRRAC